MTNKELIEILSKRDPEEACMIQYRDEDLAFTGSVKEENIAGLDILYIDNTFKELEVA